MSHSLAWRHGSGTMPGGGAVVVWMRRAGVLGACCAIPLVVFPESEVPLGWLLAGAGYAIGCGTWASDRRAARATARDPWRQITNADLVRAALFVYLVTLAVFAFVTAPLLLILWPIDPRLTLLAIVAGLSIAARTLLALPAMIAGDDASTALERAWAWADAAPVRATVIVSGLLLVAVGPAVAIAAWAGEVGHAGLVQRLLALVALTLAGGALPAGLDGLARKLDSKRRRTDRRFARP